MKKLLPLLLCFLLVSCAQVPYREVKIAPCDKDTLALYDEFDQAEGSDAFSRDLAVSCEVFTKYDPINKATGAQIFDTKTAEWKNETYQTDYRPVGVLRLLGQDGEYRYYKYQYYCQNCAYFEYIENDKIR